MAGPLLAAASREGIRGPSRVVDTSRFEIAPGPELARGDLVVYELHVGTFSDEGTFDGAIPHLPALAELGVTAIELMPVATFPGERGWGYDGLYLFAPHPGYGGPDGLARLVDAAHRAGLAVILDVVYNHLGPGSEAITAFGPYVTDRHETPWGGAIDFSQPAVREWAIQNAELWVHDFRIDGLRLDAVFAILDDSPKHVLAELRERLPGHAPDRRGGGRRRSRRSRSGASTRSGPTTSTTSCTSRSPARATATTACTAASPTWPRLYERAPPGEASSTARRTTTRSATGRPATGPRPDELELRAAALLFAPQTPLLFMGEEYGERRPFQYFTDHVDPPIAEATREGRRREFELRRGGRPRPAGPSRRSSLEALARGAPRACATLYRDLLRLRRGLPARCSARRRRRGTYRDASGAARSSSSPTSRAAP